MQYIHRKDVINPSYLSRLNKIVGGQNGFPWYFISEDISYDDATDMKFGDTELSGYIGGGKSITDSVGVYGELSGATNVDEVDWGAKAGVKYTF